MGAKRAVGVVVALCLGAAAAACGGGAESGASGGSSTASSGGEAQAGGERAANPNQQGQAMAGGGAAGAPDPASLSAPTQADVLGRDGYGGAGYGASPGAGSAIPGLIGGDREHPVPTCGAMESYLYVARDFQCPGGGNPLHGDARAGAAARIGNVGPHAHGPERDPVADSHIVDLYEVPCPGGPVQIYVCLYHCPAGRSPLD